MSNGFHEKETYFKSDLEDEDEEKEKENNY